MSAYFEAVFIPSDRWICGRGLLVAVLRGRPTKSRPRSGARSFEDDGLRLKGGMETCCDRLMSKYQADIELCEGLPEQLMLPRLAERLL